MLPRHPRLRWPAVVAAVSVAFGVGVASGSVLPDRAAEAHAAAQTGGGSTRLSDFDSRDPADRAAVDALLTAVGDEWSTFLEPREFAVFQESLEGRYSGVGVFLRRDEADVVRVTAVVDGGPADRAGIRVGDAIDSVDGTPASTLSVAELSAALRGERGTHVTVGLRSADGEPRSAFMRRERVVADDVTAHRVADDVVRISIASFSRGVGKQVRETVAEAPAGTGFVLDLRGNPGGLLDEAVEVASVFLDGGPVVQLVRGGGAAQVVEAVGEGNVDVPVIIVVDRSTASAAEVVAGALQDRGRAAIVGTRTFGKGTVQQPSRLADGSGVELTVGTYRTPDGRSIDGVGIEPDIEVEPGSEPTVALQRALAVLTGLLADARTAGRG